MRYFKWIIFTLSLSVYAQKKDTLYVESFANKINIKATLKQEGESLEVKNQTALKNYSLTQNKVRKLSFSLNYKFIALRLGFSPSFLEDRTILKGKSIYKDYRLRLFFPKVYHEFYYFQTKGFYINNTYDYLPKWQKGVNPYIRLPDFNVQELGGETRYYFSNKFGYRAIFSNVERQLKSKGTWLVATKYYYSKIENPNNDYFVLNERSYNINFIGGYAYNLVFNKQVYLFGQILPSIGVKYIITKHNNSIGKIIQENLLRPNFGVRTKIGLGYNSKKFYYGISISANSRSYNQSSINVIGTNKAFISVHLGYRFDVPKKIIHFFKKIHL